MLIILIFIILILIGAVIYLILKNINLKTAEESFLSVVNHSFRTPLTRIKWMSDSLTEDMPRKEALEMTRNLSISIDRILEILDTLSGIKDVNSTASYDIRAVSLREMIEKGIESCRTPLNAKNIALSVPTFNNIPLLSVDTKKVSFVIHSVIENAILYNKDHGGIAIAADVKNDNIILIIEDNGIGLNSRDKSNIFTQFYRGEEAKRLNTEGMGLSLFMSKEIIHRHGGTMHARSKGPGVGTAIYITLPVVR